MGARVSRVPPPPPSFPASLGEAGSGAGSRGPERLWLLAELPLRLPLQVASRTPRPPKSAGEGGRRLGFCLGSGRKRLGTSPRLAGLGRRGSRVRRLDTEWGRHRGAGSGR